jgi:hypothetical protein
MPISNVGREMGFITYARLIHNTQSSDYHNEMTPSISQNGIRNQLISGLPKQRNVVLDNDPYHNKQTKKN